MPKPTKKPTKKPTACRHMRPKAGSNANVQKLRRELRAARAALRAAEARTTCDDLRYLLGEIHTRAAAATGTIPQPNSSALAAVEDLARRVAATNAWTKLAHERLTALLGGDNAGHPIATLGGVLGLIGRLGADRAAANELIAQLAFDLSEGTEQEQIGAASPAAQRAVIEARAFGLTKLSLTRELAQGAQVVMKDVDAYNLLARIAAFLGNGTVEELEVMPAADLRVIVEASVFEDYLLTRDHRRNSAAEDVAKTPVPVAGTTYSPLDTHMVAARKQALSRAITDLRAAPLAEDFVDTEGMHKGPCEDLDGSGACFGCGQWIRGPYSIERDANSIRVQAGCVRVVDDAADPCGVRIYVDGAMLVVPRDDLDDGLRVILTYARLKTDIEGCPRNECQIRGRCTRPGMCLSKPALEVAADVPTTEKPETEPAA